MDFPVTRRMLASVEDWFMPFVEPFLPLKKVREDSGVHFEFEEHSARTMMLGKGVRIISGLRGAMILAEYGFVTECSTILRVIDDLIIEIDFLVDGYGANTPSADCETFVKQYFDPLPQTAAEYAAQAKKRYLARDKILEGYIRSVQRVTKDLDKARKSAKFVFKMFDSYVHGGYLTSMELYREKTNRFMLAGHQGDVEREFSKKLVAGRLFQSMAALMKVALLLKNHGAAEGLRSGGLELAESGELP